jgi:hypothetical protein
MKPLFKTNQDLLNHLLAQAEVMENKYNRSFEDLFLEVESSVNWTVDQEHIFHLQSMITTCKSLVRTYESGK